MMLEITIGESIAVRYDDCIDDERLMPEQVEDYLTRMRRTAVALYDGLPNDDTDEAAALLDGEAES